MAIKTTGIFFFLLLSMGKQTDSSEKCMNSSEETRDVCQLTSSESGPSNDDKITTWCPNGYLVVDCTLVQVNV